MQPLAKIKNFVGKGVKPITRVFTNNEESNKTERVNNTIKYPLTNNPSSAIFVNNDNSPLPNHRTSDWSNISISAPITINIKTDADEKIIANQVKIAIDEIMHKFVVRKQALNYD